VLLKAYHAWGPDFVQRLNGMFAFALWERDSGGCCSVATASASSRCTTPRSPAACASPRALPALLAAGGIDTAIDPVALNSTCPSTPSCRRRTPARRRAQAAAGTLMIDRADGRAASAASGARLSARMRPTSAQLRGMDGRSCSTAARCGQAPPGGRRAGRRAAVGRRRFQPDRRPDGRGRGPDLRTYNVGFEDVGGEKGNEFEYADIVAASFGTVHERIFVPESECCDALPEAVAR
jgi:asparagine synthase (glutamine-hydrolysing)